MTAGRLSRLTRRPGAVFTRTALQHATLPRSLGRFDARLQSRLALLAVGDRLVRRTSYAASSDLAAASARSARFSACAAAAKG